MMVLPADFESHLTGTVSSFPVLLKAISILTKLSRNL